MRPRAEREMYLTKTIGEDLSSYLGSAIFQVREAASHPELLMSLNLNRNAVAMEATLQMLKELVRIARLALCAMLLSPRHQLQNANKCLTCLRGQIRREHEEVCRHL